MYLIIAIVIIIVAIKSINSTAYFITSPRMMTMFTKKSTTKR